MSADAPSRVPPDERRTLLVGFALVLALFVVVLALAVLRARSADAQARRVVAGAADGIVAVTRVAVDLDEKALLIYEHILERRSDVMAHLEQRLSEVERDLGRAVARYTPPDTPEARASWEALVADLGEVEAASGPVLALSRRNEDVAARRTMDGLVDDVHRLEAQLVATSEREATRALDRIRASQRATLAALLALAAAGTAAALLVAAQVTRTIRARAELLRRATRSLEETNRELDAFAGRVAHDLRGPLSTVALAASLLQRRALAPEEAQATERLKRAVHRMEALIRDLLAFSRAGAKAEDAEGDPEAAAEQLAEDIGPRVEEQGGRLDVAVAHARVRCSVGLLREVLYNLADNALKYRRPDVAPAIAIKGEAQRADYELVVSDNGMGMAEDDARRAFDAFFRARGAAERPGTGLGLAIVKRVVEGCGGRVDARSREGSGTTFVIRLPLARGA